MFVKGAPDVVIGRSSLVIGSDGGSVHIDDQRSALLTHNDRLAAEGMRVLAVAQRSIPIEAWDEFVAAGSDPANLMSELTLLALVGIVDPPRPEAKTAIAEARSAGISVKMITGDHAVTARAIGEELGLARVRWWPSPVPTSIA